MVMPFSLSFLALAVWWVRRADAPAIVSPLSHLRPARLPARRHHGDQRLELADLHPVLPLPARLHGAGAVVHRPRPAARCWCCSASSPSACFAAHLALPHPPPWLIERLGDANAARARAAGPGWRPRRCSCSSCCPAPTVLTGLLVGARLRALPPLLARLQRAAAQLRPRGSVVRQRLGLHQHLRPVPLHRHPVRVRPVAADAAAGGAAAGHRPPARHVGGRADGAGLLGRVGAGRSSTCCRSACRDRCASAWRSSPCWPSRRRARRVDLDPARRGQHARLRLRGDRRHRHRVRVGPHEHDLQVLPRGLAPVCRRQRRGRGRAVARV